MAKFYGQTPHRAQMSFMGNGRALDMLKLMVFHKSFLAVVMVGSIALMHAETEKVVQNFYGNLIATQRSPNIHLVDVQTETISLAHLYFTKALFI